MSCTSTPVSGAAASVALSMDDGGACAVKPVMAAGGRTYNLSVNVGLGVGSMAGSAVSTLLAVESACSTPRTPEILNSLIAMTNPLDDYNYNASEKCAIGGPKSACGIDSNSNSSGSPLGSPANGSTPSIQKTCSQLIKAGLKLSIESKRKSSTSESLEGAPCSRRLKKEEPSLSEDDDYEESNMSGFSEGDVCCQLTPEDEERRRRRRERNKIAATKCRLKKRERTVNLVTESEVLETQNIDLKTQIQELEVQRRQLTDMLSHHKSACLAGGASTAPPGPPSPSPQPPYDSPATTYPLSSTPYEPSSPYQPNSPYLRPESANILASSYTCDTPYITTQEQGYYVTPAEFNAQENYNKNLLLQDMEYVEQLPPFENQDINNYQYNNHPPGGQCHNMNPSNARQKFRNSIDNGCMA